MEEDNDFKYALYKAAGPILSDARSDVYRMLVDLECYPDALRLRKMLLAAASDLEEAHSCVNYMAKQIEAGTDAKEGQE